MKNENGNSNTFWNSRCKTHQSSWLRNTLSDLDEKIMAMISIIQEEDDSSIHRDEMFQKKTQELIKMGEEFHKSYHLFVEGYDQYDQLGSGSYEPIQSESLSSMNSFSQNSTKGVIRSSVDAKPETLDTLTEAVVEGPALEFDDSKFGSESPNYAVDDQSPRQESNPIFKSNQESGDIQVGDGKYRVISITEGNENNGASGSNCRETTIGFPMGGLERVCMWHEFSFQVLKLIAENQSEQAELIRRNEAKRETIKDLYCQLHRLVNENKVLQDQLRCSKHGLDKNQSGLSKLKWPILVKFLGCGTS